MIYITYADYIADFIGVWKKVQAQYRVFKEAFGTAYYTLYHGQMLYLFNDGELIEKELAFTSENRRQVLISWLKKYKIHKSYIRYDTADKGLLAFLQQQEELGIKSVLEFTDIPYDWANGSQYNRSADKYYREKLYKHMKCCTTFNRFSEVYNIPCIVLVNGVDIKEQKEKQYRKPDGKIVLLSVASMAKHHGYDRMLQGMYNYYSNGGERNIIFNFVGEGPQLEYYNRIVNEFQLCGHVVFHGQLSGENLDKIYDNSDIAIGSLGLHRIRMQSAAPIKTGEYCARGIPFVYGYDDISFNKDNYFAYQISNDETPVDMQRIIEFYDTMYDGRDFIKDMRQYALDNLTWNTILRPVIDYLSQ